MKHFKKIKKINLPNPYPKVFKIKRKKGEEERVNEAFANVPKITNETVAEHREEILSKARKYIYPLRHSKYKIVRMSIAIFLTVLIVFLGFVSLELYKFQATSSFIYGVTEVIPFPVAKIGPYWVPYKNYLFELRRNMHYYQTQQAANFNTSSGRTQLNRLKQQAMAQVIQQAYVERLAKQYHVTVSNRAVNNEITLLQKENRLGASQQALNDVLSKFWGWNLADFKYELKSQLLQEAVVAKLDTGTYKRAETVLQQLQKGANFATLALQQSDDASTKASGGQYPQAITKNDLSLPPQVLSAIFQLKPGQLSPIINTGYSLEIIKVLSVANGRVQAAHIEFLFHNINTYIAPMKKSLPPQYFITT